MKQTAVDWLEDNLIGNPFSNEDFQHNRNVFIKAKEMEKEQIQDAYWDGIFHGEFLDGEGYYNHNYEQK